MCILGRSRLLRALVGLLCISAVGGPATAAPPTQSSPIALSSNDAVLVNVNPDNNSVTVFDLTPSTIVKRTEIAVGKDPNSVAIHPSNGKAYVANSFDGTISVLNLATNAVENTVAVFGAEPMGLALSPNGTRLYVANSSSNTLTVLNTATTAIVATVDLSAFGTSPWAVAVTNDGDGDDVDETIFVALFFGQLRPGKTASEEGQDDQREGRVVAISAATNTVLGAPNPTTLGPIANAGFNSNGKLAPAVGLTPAVASTNPQTFTTPTGAFPNQLAAIGIHPITANAYVVSTGASPNGPIRFNHNTQGMVSVFNTATRTEVTSAQTDPSFRRTAPLNLNQGINLATTPAPRLFMSNPVALAWRPDGSDAWVVVQNSDLVVRLTVDANGIPTIGAPLVAGPSSIVRVDLLGVPSNLIAGKAPRGIAITSDGSRAYVFNFVSRSITVLSISNPTAPSVLATARASNSALSLTAQLGAELFFSSGGPQGRMSSEWWGGCVVCHPNGRSDNVTWMFDTGPRQTIPLDGTFNKANPNDQRALNWSAVRDEVHDFELNTRGVFGGRGLIDDDRLFLAIGGAEGATDSTKIEQFQNLTGVVASTNDLVNNFPLPQLTALGARRDFGIATLEDDRVFLIGGRSGAGHGALVAANAVLEFNPRTNTLTARSSTGFTLRHSLGAAAVKTSDGPRIYAVGGYAGTSATDAPVGTVEEYNPATNSWRTVATMPTAVAQFGITAAGGLNTADPVQQIHAASGNTGSEAAPSVSGSFVVQRLQPDPAGPGVWSNFNVTGLTPRRNHGAATALRGVAARIFVIGGQDAAGTVLSTVEEYTNAAAPAAVNTPHTSLPAPRARCGIGSTLTTNQIYVMGGVDGSGANQTSIFEYTIANNGPVFGPPGTPSGTWVTRGNLSAARSGLGVSTPPGVTNFLPAKNKGRNSRQDAIAVWIAANVRTAKSPLPALDPDVTAGRALFAAANCQQCHGGPKWTRSTISYTPPPSPSIIIGAELQANLFSVGTFDPAQLNEIRSNPADISQSIGPLGANGFNPPSLLSVHETAPYFHSGAAQTLDDVLNNVTHRSAGTGGVDTLSNAADRARIVTFLRSIDQTTPIFP
jgi:YVTN family beta-propeller protein